MRDRMKYVAPKFERTYISFQQTLNKQMNTKIMCKQCEKCMTIGDRQWSEFEKKKKQWDGSVSSSK